MMWYFYIFAMPSGLSGNHSQRWCSRDISGSFEIKHRDPNLSCTAENFCVQLHGIPLAGLDWKQGQKKWQWGTIAIYIGVFGFDIYNKFRSIVLFCLVWDTIYGICWIWDTGNSKINIYYIILSRYYPLFANKTHRRNSNCFRTGPFQQRIGSPSLLPYE